MRKRSIFCLLFILTCLTTGRAEIPSKTVACLYDGEFEHARQVFQAIREESSVLAGNYYQLNFLPDETAQWDAGRAASLLKQYLEDPKVDIILVSGPLFVREVQRVSSLSKPVVIASILDPDVTGLTPSSDGSSGIANLYYLAKTKTLDDDIQLFRRITPFDTLSVLVEDGIKPYVQKTAERLKAKDLKVELISGTGSVEEVLKRIDEAKPKALYLTPLNLSPAGHLSLLDGINARAIPSFSYAGYEEVDQGALAGRMPRVMLQFARRIAITIDRICKGEDAGSIPVSFDVEDMLVVNQRTADQIKLALPFDVLMDAEVLYREDVQGKVLSLQQAVGDALVNNLNFKILDEQIKAVGKDYWLAWTSYLPLAQFRLDYDVAHLSEERYGSLTPKENFASGVNLNQLIFSHPVLRQISNAKKQVTIAKLTKETASLDITDQTIQAYLNYLRAKALLKVEHENLRAVIENLAVATRRLQSGVAGKEEVLRWEAELANRKSLVLFRETGVFQARVVLNQLMNQQQEEVYDEQEVGLETLTYYIGGQSMDPFVRNQAVMRAFLDFAVQKAMVNSPEIKALQVGIEQQQNNIKSADGRFILPEFFLNGATNHTIDQRFAGEAPPGDDNGWGMNLQMTYPLFDRGRRPIDSIKQRDILHQLEYSLYLKKQQIERNLRLAAYDIYTSLPSIELKRQAMVSSAAEYLIMQAKYKEGLISYVDLINTQVDKFQKEADAVIAMYDFFSTLSAFDRQSSQFYLLASEQDRQMWLEEARQYLDARGFKVREISANPL
jgi:outer membrane protein